MLAIHRQSKSTGSYWKRAAGAAIVLTGNFSTQTSAEGNKTIKVLQITVLNVSFVFWFICSSQKIYVIWGEEGLKELHQQQASFKKPARCH